MSNFIRNNFKNFKTNLNPFKKSEPVKSPTTPTTPTPTPTPSPTQATEQTLNKLTDSAASVTDKSNQIVKTTLVQKATNYVKNLAYDYKEVGKDTLIYAKNNPIRSSLISTGLIGMVVLYKKNPTYIDYTELRRQYLNEMIMCGSTFNKNTEYYLDSLNKLENSNLIEYKSYYFFSLILARNFTEFDSSYEKQCAQLNNPSKYNIFNWFYMFLRFAGRIIDIGIFDNWIYLNKNTKGYDIDEDEWNQNEMK